MSLEGEVLAGDGRGVSGMCRWRRCGRSKIKTSNTKKLLKPKGKREKGNQREAGKIYKDMAGWCGGGTLTSMTENESKFLQRVFFFFLKEREGERAILKSQDRSFHVPS
jgi:hypothetical protein